MTYRRLALAIAAAAAAAFALAGCAGREAPVTRIETVEVVREVPRPCPADIPERPAPIGQLPSDLETLAALLGAKLKEWASPGGYGDRAAAIIARCASEPISP